MTTDKLTGQFDYTAYSKKRTKWQNRTEFDTVNRIRTRFSEMAEARRRSCFFKTDQDVQGDISLADDAESDADWVARWNKDYILRTMIKEYAEDEINIKASTTFAPIEAILAEFQESEHGVIIQSDAGTPKVQGQIWNAYIRALANKGKFGRVLATWYLETLITGTGIVHIDKVEKIQEAELILSGKQLEDYLEAETKGNGDRKKEIEKQIKEDKKPVTKKEKIVKYNDGALINVSIFDFYTDPSAINLQGLTGDATDCVWRQKMSYTQFKNEYSNSNDPWVIKGNIDKVQPAKMTQDTYDEVNQFFKLPIDLINFGDKVEILKYYNKITDEEIYIANDILIRKGPLKWNHKELPFAKSILIELPNQFYGMGICAVLENNQTFREAFMNASIRATDINLNKPLIVNEEVFEDIDSNWTGEAGSILKVSGSVGPQNMQWAPDLNIPFDYYKLLEDIDTQSVSIVGINPISYSIPTPGQPVRNNLMIQESVLKIIRKYVKYWGYGLEDATKQLIGIAMQTLPTLYKEIKDSKTGETIKRYPMIPMQNGRLVNNEGKIEVEEISGVSEFEFKPELIDLDADLNVSIDLNQYLPMSTALKAQEARETMMDLLPILSNPQFMQNPSVVKLVRNYAESRGMPQDFIDTLKDDDTEESIYLAEQQNIRMLQGQEEAGRPGSSDAHIMTHLQAIIDIVAQKQQVTDQFMQEVGMNPMIDPTSIQVQLQEFDMIIAIMNRHLTIDSQPKADPSVGMQLAQASSQSSMPPQPAEGMQMTPENQMATPEGQAPLESLGGTPL